MGLLQEGIIVARVFASHASGALANVLFLARLLISTWDKRFAVSGEGRCLGITASVSHSAMMIALAR